MRRYSEGVLVKRSFISAKHHEKRSGAEGGYVKSLLGQVLPVLSLLSLLFFACFPATPVHGVVKIDSELRKLMSEDESTGYIIHFKSKLSLKKAYAMEWKARGRFVADTLRDTANESQAGVKAYLKDRNALYKSFWVGNMIVVEASDLATLNGLEDFPEIDRIARRPRIVLHEPVEIFPATQNSSIAPNLSHVRVDQVWTTLGIKGSGVTVANIDTGVRYTHQALVNQYRGNSGGAYNHNYNWWDPYGDHPAEPGDDLGHGSHTMGVMVGSDGGSNQTGMAPEARWIACRACSTSSCSDTALFECGQWVIAPWDLNKSSPDPDLRPQVVNNSWSDCSRSYEDFFQDVIDAWHAAGIYPVFSAGNAGNCGYPEPPGCGTIGGPGRLANVTAVGATGTSDGQYASFSNWGPTDTPDTVNPGGYPYVKPQVVAPGASIVSSYNSGDGGYVSMSGTSMAAPHVAGLVALMLNACPSLSQMYGKAETLIQRTAVPIPYASNCGGEGPGNVPNNATGWGEIDALAAVRSAAESCTCGAVTGTVRDARTKNAIEGAKVTGAAGTTTDASGRFTLDYLPPGSQNLNASRQGYYDRTITMTIAKNATTTVDISLEPKAMTTLTGKVTDGSGAKWPLYGTVAATSNDETVRAFTNAATGAYTMKLYKDTAYALRVSSTGYTTAETTFTTTGKFSPRNFSLMVGPDCSAQGYALSGGACAVRSGGLVTGLTRDANTKSLVPGIVVNSIFGTGTSDSSGRYVFFSPAGNSPFVGNPSALSNYGSLTRWVTVTAGKIVTSNFDLPAPVLKGPKSVSVTLAQGSTKKATVKLQNAGGVSTPFTLTSTEAAWLGISPASGVLEAKKTQSVTLSFDAAGMSAGVHSALINVSGVTPYDPLSIPVTMKVTAAKKGGTWDETNYGDE